ncbi:unannotated protein [freshwater metagenome]|uniref:Unannotated protein n=1 Tax=freshwater metagenome TaxID=449393 RepID=A0A6J6VEW6_9ZZZZ
MTLLGIVTAFEIAKVTEDAIDPMTMFAFFFFTRLVAAATPPAALVLSSSLPANVQDPVNLFFFIAALT